MSRVNIRFDRNAAAARISNSVKAAMPELATQVLKDCNFYAPQRRGTLISTSIMRSDTSSPKATLKWDVPYAEYVFKGLSKRGNPLKYSKYPNRNAQSHWTNKAKSVKLVAWERLAEVLIKEKMNE